MMRIAIFYHALMSATDRPIDEDYALDIIINQISAMQVSGLTEAANEIHFHINGNDDEREILATISPEKAKVVSNGPNRHSEIPTLYELQMWSKAHPGWAVLYHHTKGVSTKNMADNWRRRMETHLVWNWEGCVDYLKKGYDAVGCHWLTPEAHPGRIATPFFGGNMWWANTNYINRLPPLPEDTWNNRYMAEEWIGKGNPRPKIHDPSPGWPAL